MSHPYEIVSQPESGELNFKRCYLGGVIRSECPECGKVVDRDFNGDYLSYPKFGTPITVHMGHEEDGEADDGSDYVCHEWEVTMVIRIRLEKP